MKVIDVQNVYLKYRTAKEDTIRGISFDVKQGEIFGFLGPSGAGKSTMQKILTGTLRDYRGIYTTRQVCCVRPTPRCLCVLPLGFRSHWKS